MYNITTSEAKLKDWKFVYDLRFHPDHIKVSNNRALATETESKHWFKSHFSEFEIIFLDFVPVGYLQKTSNGGVHISIMLGYRGRGIGTTILKQATGITTIRANNVWALETFQKAGWKVTGWMVEK